MPWKKLASHSAALLVGVIGASLAWGYYMSSQFQMIAHEVRPIRETDGAYRFIAPLLAYRTADLGATIGGYGGLRDAMNAAMSSPATGVGDFGIYFQDLSVGLGVNVNGSEGFAPGSLMKVVVMIAYFKEAESDPSVLDTPLMYSSATADELNGVPFETPSSLAIGQRYSVEQLIEAMIENSDNGAKNALLNNIDNGTLNQVYSDLNLPYLDPNADYSQYRISAAQYSFILRVLYNATYLNPDYSEKALGIMSQSLYDKGLAAFLPSGTAVAHKFGESVNASGPGAPVVTLSDCGIIYFPENPYLLCAMTAGTNVNALTSSIADLSRAVWDYTAKASGAAE